MDINWLVKQMSSPGMDGKVTLSSAGGAPGVSGIKFDLKPFQENPSLAPSTFNKGASQPAQTDQQGQYALLTQVLSGIGSGLLDKDNPAMAIGATANTVGKNVAGNLALKKYLAQILGEGGSGGQSNF